MRSLGSRTAALLIAALFVVPARADNEPPNAKLGKKIDNVSFKAADGKTSALYDLKDKKAVVLVFLSFECPVSKSYSPILAELHKTYDPKGVAFIGLCPCDEGADHVAKMAAEYKIPFPVFKDDGAIGDAVKAEVTPEAFLLEGPHFTLRYRGRIDDTWAARLKKKEKGGREDLKLAIDELLSGRGVSEPSTQPIGCPIDREKKAPTSNAVTYHRDVLPILQKNCQGCHRPGEVGPFSLMTYKQASNWATDIKEYTKNKQMPPWKPTAGPAFRDERGMSSKDIETLASWVDAGAPEGDPKDAPAPRKFTDGWQLGKPDLVLSVPEDFNLAATGHDVFRCFALPTGLDEDKYVSAVEVRPGNTRIVHHALIFLDNAGRARQMEKSEKDREKKEDEPDHGPGYSVAMGVGFTPSGGMGGWAPGQVTRRLPDDTAYFLPKGSDVVLQLHYHRDGRAEKDRTQIGLYFTQKPAARRFQSLVVAGRFLFIPPDVEDHEVKGSIWVEQDCDLHSVMPHMHMLGKSIKVSMTPPKGEAQTLVEIKDWDYNWQETYFFKDTISVKAGTRFDIEAHYDNSKKNPRNPFNPPKFVKIGEQTTDEMCFGFLGVTAEKPGRIKATRTAPRDEK